jgi:hypothetical protein
MAKPPRKPRKPLGEYKVGYCKTPEETRFPHQVIRRKRGPKPQKSLDDYIEEILDSTRRLPGPGGRMRRVTVREFLAHSAVKRALEGDRQMYAEIAKRDAARRGGAASDEPPADDALDPDDEAIIAAFLREQGKKSGNGEDGGDADKGDGADEGGADEGRNEEDEGGGSDEEGS